MVCELIAVGTELLMGQIANTDGQYLASAIKDLGFNLYHQTVVGDNFEKLTDLLQVAWQRSDLIITTGGTGPTEDDMTKECIARFLGLELVLDETTLQTNKEMFAKRGRVYTPNNDKQAYFPVGSKILPNPNGTAPGCIIERDGKIIVILPGPPREMNPMFEDDVWPYLQQYSDSIIYPEYVQVIGLGESQTEFQIRDIIDKQSNPTIAPYVKPGFITIRVAAKAKNKEQARRLNQPVIEEITARLGEHVYTVGERTLPELVAEYLTREKRTLAVSESCTGGKLSDAFISISGSSAYYDVGAITYSNQAKMEVLGVKEDTLKQFGAVSEQVAREMAEGVRKLRNTDIGLSTTGIAGPHSDETNKPVGLVYIGMANAQETIVEELHLFGDRENIRTMAVLHVMDMIRRYYKIK